MHPVYRDLILARVQAAIGAARAARGITHNGLLGEIREILLRDLFRPLLPTDAGLGSGQLVSHTGQTSKQTDVILYDRRILPPILFQESAGLFPVDCALNTIEVKSTLTAQELRSTHNAAEELLQLDYLNGYYDAEDVGQDQIITKCVSTLFALDSDLVDGGKAEHERYAEMYTGEPPLRAICVVGRGCWIWRLGSWVSVAQPYELAEVVAFVSMLMNSYRDIAATRGAPRLGMFLMDT
jgi:hypothetical protein